MAQDREQKKDQQIGQEAEQQVGQRVQGREQETWVAKCRQLVGAVPAMPQVRHDPSPSPVLPSKLGPWAAM